MKNAEMVSALREGRSIDGLKVFGKSMIPLILSGQTLKIEPVSAELKEGQSRGTVLLLAAKVGLSFCRLTTGNDSHGFSPDRYFHVSARVTKPAEPSVPKRGTGVTIDATCEYNDTGDTVMLQKRRQII